MTLKLIIKQRWLNLLIRGIKKEEYREITPYYESRIEKKKYDFVEFYVGGYFGEAMPRAKFSIVSIDRGKGNPEWGAPNYDTYRIKVGDLIEKTNIGQDERYEY